jgi:hypothetical protein
MADIIGPGSEICMTLEIVRAATGETETIDVIGTVTEVTEEDEG